MVRYLALLLFTFLSPGIVWAAPPKGVITLRLDNGTVLTYSNEDYAVVKRRPHQHHVKPAPRVVTVTQYVQQPAPAPKKNRVRAMAGIGPQGVDVQGGPRQYQVSPSEQFVAGIGYNRLLVGPWSVDAQAMTNKTFTLGVGFDF